MIGIFAETTEVIPMKLLYFSSNITQRRSALDSVLIDYGKDIELVPIPTEQDLIDMLPQSDAVIIQECNFERLLLQIVSGAENISEQKKLAVIKEPRQFTPKTIPAILKQLYSQNITLRFPIKNGEIEVDANDILYFEYCRRFVFIKTQQERIKTSLKLKDIPSIVSGCPFFSPYVSFMVNLMYVEAVKGNSVQLKNGELIPLSQKKAARFRREYKQYLSIMS